MPKIILHLYIELPPKFKITALEDFFEANNIAFYDAKDVPAPTLEEIEMLLEDK